MPLRLGRRTHQVEGRAAQTGPPSSPILGAPLSSPPGLGELPIISPILWELHYHLHISRLLQCMLCSQLHFHSFCKPMHHVDSTGFYLYQHLPCLFILNHLCRPGTPFVKSSFQKVCSPRIYMVRVRLSGLPYSGTHPFCGTGSEPCGPLRPSLRHRSSRGEASLVFLFL